MPLMYFGQAGERRRVDCMLSLHELMQFLCCNVCFPKFAFVQAVNDSQTWEE